ncbi:oligosaccharide flippase family protein [Mameliella sediminis]|uniref:oligosaccharide flippase family protein n=1 Tax=Mameliella sediminis TaxID=2836866 RepID=UPI001C455DAA|nr:oligosaccharide flippase family protein [Mameliella sediminis]MBY6113882.1 oligosaccharide flippase family protein [Antarctobacter heliothermus]MBY6142770.1 oligosaccharide flippase family protein [Mameliella alba]MBV7395179.1 oligosaccharide flippase family protein [Mameliella sediminis]MBY6159625.1 oligosaccharide flippase family protein [Mameliella alba]MBY6168096.1 oligosaccharide flippase family protein [Mameliella alba]
MTASAALDSSSVTARAMRSSLLTLGSFGFAQMVRLGSNLILTRLLFPEAFGLMALVMVFLMGLGQFSDVGVTPAILQSRRGDDQDFLDTAWTIQVIRGFGLWLVACALAWPMAWIYDQPMLTWVLPVSALTLLITGFRPTRMITANRHLMLGRVTVIDMFNHLAGVVVAVALAWWWGSVWALVVSGVIGALVEVAVNWRFLPGPANRLRWEKPAARELISFGKWVFLATVCGFFFTQADKMLIGKFIPLDAFGVYNIGFFWASFPLMLGNLVTHKILIPVYRETPPKQSRANFLKLRKMRFAVSLFLIGFVGAFALLGVWLVETLYDPRYADAGAVAVVLACAQIPMLIVMTYDQAALAAGDSRRYFYLALARAVLMVGCISVGLYHAGLFGALVGQAAAFTLAYPVVVWLARRMGAWDGLHDVVMAAVGLALAMLALWLNWSSILQLWPSGSP